MCVFCVCVRVCDLCVCVCVCVCVYFLFGLFGLFVQPLLFFKWTYITFQYIIFHIECIDSLKFRF